MESARTGGSSVTNSASAASSCCAHRQVVEVSFFRLTCDGRLCKWGGRPWIYAFSMYLLLQSLLLETEGASCSSRVLRVALRSYTTPKCDSRSRTRARPSQHPAPVSLSQFETQRCRGGCTAVAGVFTTAPLFTREYGGAVPRQTASPPLLTNST